jgi:methyl-accepting chemotaxis protein PixJ
MNSKQLPISTNKIRQFVQSHLFLPMNVALIANVLLIGILVTNTWNDYQAFRDTVERQFKIENKSGEIKYLGEVLTMSARIAATTGDLGWEKRYNEFAPKLDAAIQYVIKNSTDTISAQAQSTNQDKIKLVKMETDAFALMRKGEREAAQALLFSQQYNQQKAIYAKSNNLLLTQTNRLIQRQFDGYQRQLMISIGLAIGFLPILLGSWILVLSAIRHHLRDQQLMQDSWQTTQNQLLFAQDALEKETHWLQQRKQIVQENYERLQRDVGELLGVVSEIESGNLTIQAPVNNRSTGLVGNTINQLIKELSKTLRQVAVAGQQMQGAVNIQQGITTTITDHIDRQDQSLGKVWRLAKIICQSAQSSKQQSVKANQSLVVLQAAVTDGQSTITTLSRNINMLEVGSDRIVQEIKTLAEFVGLTDQFVQDQGEIVTQTKILALNAALVASRAAEQRDPKQFTIVAREFELIATQVSQLAQQTNDGLTSLEQRSSQIHRVVSAVNIDVQQLGTVVNSFTEGVKHTQEVFSQVQSVTEQVVKLEKNMAVTSQKIAENANTTVADIEAMTVLAQQTLQHGQATQELSDRLHILSQNLLENIQKLRLPPATMSIDFSPQPQVITAEFAPKI